MDHFPQGWTKFYEFGTSDLRSGAEIIDRLCAKSGTLSRTCKTSCTSTCMKLSVFLFFFSITSGRGQIQWEFVHGLMESAIYGGRVDNVFDMQVMVSYLKLFFDDGVLGDSTRASKRLGPLRVPSSSSYRV